MIQRVKQTVKRALTALGYELRSLRYVPRQLRDPDSLRTVEFNDVVCRRMFDVKHLTTGQREDCLDRLRRFGYRFAPSGDEDMMALQF